MYVVVVWLFDGVPESTPFAKVNPSGTPGEMPHSITSPPPFVTVTLVMVMFLVNTWASTDKLGMTSLTTMFTVTLLSPPPLVAVMM